MSDSDIRHEVLDTRRSFCVTAPAGSGKTSLLTQRVLALLVTVDRPEQVLAITFTRKAAAEMRERVMEALQSAEHGFQPENEHEARTHSLAGAVLAHAGTLNWSLTAESLNVRTIDGLAAQMMFCRSIRRPPRNCMSSSGKDRIEAKPYVNYC